MRTGRGKTLFGKCTRSYKNKRPLNQHVKRSNDTIERAAWAQRTLAFDHESYRCELKKSLLHFNLCHMGLSCLSKMPASNWQSSPYVIRWRNCKRKLLQKHPQKGRSCNSLWASGGTPTPLRGHLRLWFSYFIGCNLSQKKVYQNP